jgi:hypothetical protein
MTRRLPREAQGAADTPSAAELQFPKPSIALKRTNR